MQQLITRVQTANSLLCVGLDPIGTDAEVAVRLRQVVAETHAYAAVFKPNLAFFLSREDGVALLKSTIQRIPADIPVILDGKFGDIANTAAHYARFAYDVVGAHGGHLSDLAAQVARQLDEELPEAIIGLVVGATEPAAMARVRAACPRQWFLVPGIGAQGGDLAATLKAGLRKDGSGVLINASRSIWQAADAGKAAQELRDQINAFRLVKS